MYYGSEKVINEDLICNKCNQCCLRPLRLNPWSHMDYFTDVLATFLCADGGNILAVYVRFRELSELCVQKMNKYLTGSERHEGE